ncbi:phosphotransferase family protein [Cellulosimicrobium cellulans]|uniref:phosphotransferase family protein n=1 Tax=Cellulosimicrobium cellulans TaxID=1710 RepID=UPI002096E891|nr:aminoglycoside phosphotransferase family protein [Cellulosimicrobium cellulans]MCO7273806.1 aminoglycoside phosphotransferase family protein [Cellulosimicrobium cellulans]
MLTKTSVTHDQLAAIVAPLGEAVRSEALSGGMFASVFAVDLAPRPGGDAPDGAPVRVVVKVTGADTSRLLRYEHGILTTEDAAYRAAHAAGLPVPRVLHADLTREHVDGDALVVTFLDGALWSGRELDAAATAVVRRGLGSFMARLHGITGDRFGYPAPASDLAAATWPDAFARMVGAVLDDARRWGVELPETRVLDAVARHRDLLARVTVPRLVHADLWPGNVLLGRADVDAGPTIVGVLDAERSLWGDPMFELAGADQLGTGPVDPDLLAGYAAAGGDLGLGDGTPGSGDADAWTRLRLYRAYLACLLVVEVVPRAYEGDWVEGYAATARANLGRMLDELGS